MGEMPTRLTAFPLPLSMTPKVETDFLTTASKNITTLGITQTPQSKRGPNRPTEVIFSFDFTEVKFPLSPKLRTTEERQESFKLFPALPMVPVVTTMFVSFLPFKLCLKLEGTLRTTLDLPSLIEASVLLQ